MEDVKHLTRRVYETYAAAWDGYATAAVATRSSCTQTVVTRIAGGVRATAT